MKKVLLLGDSIRMGYDDYVKEELDGKCEVVYDAEDNGRFAAYTLWQANQMFKHHGHFDVVHWNNGYWDMNIEAPMTEAMHPVEEYVHFLKRIIKLCRENGAKIIFATTTPILEPGMAADNTGTQADSINYNNEWVELYNNAAKKLMDNLKIPAIAVSIPVIRNTGPNARRIMTAPANSRRYFSYFGSGRRFMTIVTKIM